MMEKDFNDYIECLRYEGKPLTVAQAKAVAYWEFEDFKRNSGLVACEYHKMFTDLKRGLDDEMSALV